MKALITAAVLAVVFLLAANLFVQWQDRQPKPDKYDQMSCALAGGEMEWDGAQYTCER